MTQRRRTPTEMIKLIQQRRLEGQQPIEIFHELEKRYPGTNPSRRTVEYIAKDVTPRDLSGDWRLADAQPEEARLVLPVLAEVVHRTGGQTASFSIAEAGWIARLRTAVPDLPAWEAYESARRYMGLIAQDKPTTRLDLYLAIGPWRGAEATAQFIESEPATAVTPEGKATRETLARMARRLPGVVRIHP